MHNDDDYAIDPKGYRVLIGLTIEETEELFRLDAVLSVPGSHAPLDEIETPEEKRWSELLDRHEAAMKPFRHMRLIKH